MKITGRGSIQITEIKGNALNQLTELWEKHIIKQKYCNLNMKKNARIAINAVV